jgi:hypothetical protein
MSLTSSAPWETRSRHTSVIDAAGAIYVIGGYDDTTIYQDVWASTREYPRGTRGSQGY